jgi:hypothetical protein
MSAKTSKVLKALTLVDQFFSTPNKWRKSGGGSNSRYCLLQGSYRALPAPRFPLLDHVNSELKRTLGIHPEDSLAEWNDAPERKFADVKKLIADTRKRLKRAYSAKASP